MKSGRIETPLVENVLQYFRFVAYSVPATVGSERYIL